MTDSTYFDEALKVGYAHIADRAVKKTIEYTSTLLVDVDENDEPVGIEVLGPISAHHVYDMGQRYGWTRNALERVDEAVAQLRQLMSVRTESSGDGIFNRATSWTDPRALAV
ncbi:DUF2283 domain-containing protein [Zhihengliuella sp.]|uniref:DUF2283 domain-containing protein n=1 Tax=Zhihengliuella sp. TaxID=1954483 RepID=UPI002811C3B6|nr:DUF2283 domain-containing protein [Zhihengliuella sp.]